MHSDEFLLFRSMNLEDCLWGRMYQAIYQGPRRHDYICIIKKKKKKHVKNFCPIWSQKGLPIKKKYYKNTPKKLNPPLSAHNCLSQRMQRSPHSLDNPWSFTFTNIQTAASHTGLVSQLTAPCVIVPFDLCCILYI